MPSPSASRYAGRQPVDAAAKAPRRQVDRAEGGWPWLRSVAGAEQEAARVALRLGPVAQLEAQHDQAVLRLAAGQRALLLGRLGPLDDARCGGRR